MIATRLRRSFALLGPLALFALALPATAVAAPRLALSASSLNFGRVPQHQVFTRELTISNRGDSELLLTEVYTSCSCTELSLAAERVPPGGSTRLTVHFHSRDLSGDNSKTIEISSNDPAQPMGTEEPRGPRSR